MINHLSHASDTGEGAVSALICPHGVPRGADYALVSASGGVGFGVGS